MWKEEQEEEEAESNYRSYANDRDGQKHAPPFRASVTLDGHAHTFESVSVKEAEDEDENEDAAAQPALDGRSANPLTGVYSEPNKISSNLQTEANTEQKEESVRIVLANGERMEETLERENVLSTCECGIRNTTVLEKSELKDKISQFAQASQSFPSPTIHVLPLEGFFISENSGKAKNEIQQSSMTGISRNKTNKEERDDMGTATCMLEKSQQNEVIHQLGGISSPHFFPGLYKNQLQDFAVRGGFGLPCYSYISEGPPHVPRFKATVEFNGKTFKSPGFFNTLKEAEHGAAMVALKSMAEKGSSLDESSIYKNLLQEKAQKEKKPLPNYNIFKSGPSHMPVFTCILKFDGMIFEGKATKKKQAEKNAASIAWSTLVLKDVKRSDLSTLQIFDGRAKAPVCEPSDHAHVQKINHVKEEAPRQSHDTFSHIDLSTSLSAVSLSEPSETYNTGSKKQLIQNMTSSVPGNRDEDKVLQPSNKLFPTKFPSGTRIRVIPVSEAVEQPLGTTDLSSKEKPWAAMNLTESLMQSKNNDS